MDNNELSMYEFFESINFTPPHMQFLRYTFENEKKIEEIFKNYRVATEYIFDALNFLLIRYSAYYGHFYLVKDRPYNGLLWTAFIKNSYSFYSAFDMMKQGLYGSLEFIEIYL